MPDLFKKVTLTISLGQVYNIKQMAEEELKRMNCDSPMYREIINKCEETIDSEESFTKNILR